MKIDEIQDLIKFVSKSGVSEVELEMDGVKLVIKTDANNKKGRKGAAQPELPPQMIQQMPMAAAPIQQMPAPQPVAQQPAAQPAAAPAAEAPKAAESDDSKYITVKSPMIGTFYRKPSPDKDVFVNVGDTIQPGNVLCIIEAMKLFNEIESEVSGKIVKILVDEATPVEFDQPLFLVDPS